MLRTIIFCALVASLLVSCGKTVASFQYGVYDPISSKVLDQPEGVIPQAPVRIEFTNQSERAESYEWDFGDGSFSSDPNPVHEYRTSGNFLVSLKAIKGRRVAMYTKRIVINAPERCLVEISTSLGNIVIWLYDNTPKHRDNFIKLVEEGFYNDLLFHRVIQGFMVQGGDPDSKGADPGVALGRGGPGYTVPEEIGAGNVHVKGALAAARKSDQVNPNRASSGSQFYLVQGAPVSDKVLDQMQAKNGMRYSPEQREAYVKYGGTPHLDGLYTVFGKVVEGLEVIDQIAAQKVDGANRPYKDIKMTVQVIK
ncbi:MAG: peptidylprolyl isomerase [Bacteroidota bacterium]